MYVIEKVTEKKLMVVLFLDSIHQMYMGRTVSVFPTSVKVYLKAAGTLLHRSQ